jgi:hypothetical protein
VLRSLPPPPPPTIVAWETDAVAYTITPQMSDGTLGLKVELRGLFERYDDETRGS